MDHFLFSKGFELISIGFEFEFHEIHFGNPRHWAWNIKSFVMPF